MKKLKQKILMAIRGFIYTCFYRIPVDIRLRHISDRKHIIPITIGNITYYLAVNPHEGGLSEDVYINHIREYPNVNFFHDYLEQEVPALQTFIGIGSNIGYYAFLTDAIVRRKQKSATLYALEPVKSTYDELVKNIEINKSKLITPLNVGISNKDGDEEMIVAKQKNLSRLQNASTTPIKDTDHMETVHLVTLQTLCSKHHIPEKDIFIRCDIEGYEYQLIVGNKEFLKKLTNTSIVMEFHPFYLGPEKSVELFQTLQSLGFTLQQVISCEPLYFLHTPKYIRSFLIRLFLIQYHGETLGKLTSFHSINDLIIEIQKKDSPLYHYPNLHLYFKKP